MKTLAIAALGLIVIWGALAFGAVYTWAFVPLAIASAIIGLLGLIWPPRGRPPLVAMSAALAAIGLAVAFQLAPLPRTTLGRLSPKTDEVLASLSTGFLSPVAGIVRPIDGEDPRSLLDAPHPISIAPSQTRIGLGLFVALALLLVGATRALSVTGARPLGFTLLIFGGALAIFAIVQEALFAGERFVLIYGFWKPIGLTARPFGPFVNRNHFAGWVLMALPVALGAWYGEIERVGEDTRPGLRDRLAVIGTPVGGRLLLMGFACALMGLALMIARSRSGIAAFGLMACLAAASVVRRRASWRARLLLTGALFVFVAGAASWAGLDAIVGRFQSDSTSMDSIGGRIPAWRDTLRIIKDFPLTGSGLDTYGTAMVAYQSEHRELLFEEAHNDYLQLAAEGGLLTAVPALLAVVMIVRDVRRRFREAPKVGTTYWIRVGAVIGLVSIAAQSIFEFSLQMPGNAALFALLVAIALHQSPNLRVRVR